MTYLTRYINALPKNGCEAILTGSITGMAAGYLFYGRTMILPCCLLNAAGTVTDIISTPVFTYLRDQLHEHDSATDHLLYWAQHSATLLSTAALGAAYGVTLISTTLIIYTIALGALKITFNNLPSKALLLPALAAWFFGCPSIYLVQAAATLLGHRMVAIMENTLKEIHEQNSDDPLIEHCHKLLQLNLKQSATSPDLQKSNVKIDQKPFIMPLNSSYYVYLSLAVNSSVDRICCTLFEQNDKMIPFF